MTSPAITFRESSACARTYLIDPNAKQAAIRTGYSAKTATEIGHENLRKPHVAEAIEKAQTKRAARFELTADWVVDELRIRGRSALGGRRRLVRVVPRRGRGLAQTLRDLGLRFWRRDGSGFWRAMALSPVAEPKPAR